MWTIVRLVTVGEYVNGLNLDQTVLLPEHSVCRRSRPGARYLAPRVPMESSNLRTWSAV